MTPEEAAALRKPFPREAIGKLPKAGVQLDYVGHAATTDRLLSVDPTWTYEIVSLDDTGQPLPIVGKGLWIRLTVCGVTRYGFGDGSSIKECIGDAIRNAAMRFGVALDLWSKEELEQAHGPAQPTPQPSGAESRGGSGEVASAAPARVPTSAPEPLLLNTGSQLAKAMYAGIHEAGIPEADRLSFICDVIGREVSTTKDMTEDEARRVLDHLPNREPS